MIYLNSLSEEIDPVQLLNLKPFHECGCPHRCQIVCSASCTRPSLHLFSFPSVLQAGTKFDGMMTLSLSLSLQQQVTAKECGQCGCHSSHSNCLSSIGSQKSCTWDTELARRLHDVARLRGRSCKQPPDDWDAGSQNLQSAKACCATSNNKSWGLLMIFCALYSGREGHVVPPDDSE